MLPEVLLPKVRLSSGEYTVYLDSKGKQESKELAMKTYDETCKSLQRLGCLDPPCPHITFS